jgi:hypothetical protein
MVDPIRNGTTSLGESEGAGISGGEFNASDMVPPEQRPFASKRIGNIEKTNYPKPARRVGADG